LSVDLAPLSPLCSQSLDKGSDQLVRNRLAQTELGGAFAGEIGSDLGFESVVELRNRIETDVLLPAAKVDNWPAVDAEGRNAVADRLLEARSGSVDRFSCPLQDCLDLRWKAVDVVID
jgi:hypothetical protein